MPTTIRVTDTLAQRHEALWLKLTALLDQGRDIAIKKPEAPVADEARIIAEGLLHDCAMFAPKGRREACQSPPANGGHWPPSWGRRRRCSMPTRRSGPAGTRAAIIACGSPRHG